MKRFLILTLTILISAGYCCAQQSAADQPASKEDIERYLAAVDSKGMMAKMADAMTKPMHQMVHEQYEKNKEKLPPDFEARMNKIMDEYMTSFPWNEILDSMVPVYQKHFTKGDVDSMVAFYQTPTGQKMLREMPEIMSEALQNMMPLIQKNVDKMNRKVQDEVAAMLNESEDKGSKSNQIKN
jgi:uncharacterized protein